MNIRSVLKACIRDADEGNTDTAFSRLNTWWNSPARGRVSHARRQAIYRALSELECGQLDRMVPLLEAAMGLFPAGNPCLSTRDKSNPYEVWTGNGWTWRVLKKWQADDAKPYARWFCFVTSPYCPEGEYGDVYVSDIKREGGRLAV